MCLHSATYIVNNIHISIALVNTLSFTPFVRNSKEDYVDGHVTTVGKMGIIAGGMVDRWDEVR